MLLLSIMLQIDVDDIWSWSPDPVAGYTVCGAYKSPISEMRSSPSVPLGTAPLL